jgi:hypothetical protein
VSVSAPPLNDGQLRVGSSSWRDTAAVVGVAETILIGLIAGKVSIALDTCRL